MTPYETDMAQMQAFVDLHGGYVYESGNGSCLWSSETMTDTELSEHWAEVDANSAYIDAHSEEYDYEPYYTLGEPRVF